MDNADQLFRRSEQYFGEFYQRDVFQAAGCTEDMDGTAPPGCEVRPFNCEGGTVTGTYFALPSSGHKIQLRLSAQRPHWGRAARASRRHVLERRIHWRRSQIDTMMTDTVRPRLSILIVLRIYRIRRRPMGKHDAAM